MPKFLIRYAEIGLKGKNRYIFENQLIKNISASLDIPAKNIKKSQKQLILSTQSSKTSVVEKKLKNVFGIAWFTQVTESKPNLEDIVSQSIKLVKPKLDSKSSFAVRAQRIDKRLRFTSLDIAKQVGYAVQKTNKARVDLSNPDITLYISVFKDKAFIYLKKISGPGGLPVGTSGKVLCLLSGGFDSITASYLMAKRGAQVDFLHFHVFPDHKKVKTSKISKIIQKLSKITLTSKTYLASYTSFQIKVLDLPHKLASQELIVFRRLMVKIGELLSQKHHYQALVLGDSLGQVASQTMENICAVDQAVNIPIFRPLIGMDKKDIINIIRIINLEKEVNLPYKDCCSIVSKSPATKTNLNKVKIIEENINLDKIAANILKDVQIINF